MRMHIGIDDTDSVDGMCTTYLASIIWEKLGTTCRLKGFPRLIRLNPNIPYKTRGNGAVSMEVEGDPGLIMGTVLEYVEKYARMDDERTNPGVVFMESMTAEEKKILEAFYERAVSELVSIDDAQDAAKKTGAEVHKFKNGRGIIGALAAIGANLPDKTFEFIAYRKGKKKEKLLDKESVIRMDEKTYPKTFNNIDRKTGRILITPRGYDPVFCGIRGETPEIVTEAYDMLKIADEIERTQVFETNQGTDAHMRHRKVRNLKPYDCALLTGRVTKTPESIEGGHVVFELTDSTGPIECAAYKPTGDFRKTVARLEAGDKTKAYGCIGKYPQTLNLEKLEILELAAVEIREPPICCGVKMTSAGAGKGFKCRKCARRACREDAIKKEKKRDIKQGIYEADAGARRHLSMPVSRMKKKEIE